MSYILQFYVGNIKINFCKKNLKSLLPVGKPIVQKTLRVKCLIKIVHFSTNFVFGKSEIRHQNRCRTVTVSNSTVEGYFLVKLNIDAILPSPFSEIKLIGKDSIFHFKVFHMAFADGNFNFYFTEQNLVLQFA